MLSTQGYAAMTAKAALQSFIFERRDVGPHDVLIAITHCGICHSDIHQARDEWSGSISPMVPGHEIVGTVAQVGSAVKKVKTNDRVGVGCFVDSCGPALPVERDQSSAAKPACFSRTVAETKTASLRMAVTPRRLSWMSITCYGFPQPCRLQRSPTLVPGNYNILPASPLGRRQISQACGGGIRWTGPYGCEDWQGARNRSDCLEHL